MSNIGHQNEVFSALADQNRRRIIELLSDGDSTLLQLSDHFTFSFQALSKHIMILEKAEIISKRVEGKYRILSLNKQAMASSLIWISHHSDFWKESFDQLENLIDENIKIGNTG